MLISIIIPIYNVEKYLNRCLDSVMKQSFQDIEIILVNDGSTDNSDNIIKSYLFDERIKYIYQKNKGLSEARNTGLNIASGEYVLFLDSDDSIEPNTCYELSQVIERFEVDIVVFGRYLIKDCIEKVRDPAYWGNNLLDGKEYLVQAKLNNRFSASACNRLYKLSFLRQRGLNFKSGIVYEDLLFNFQCMIQGARVYVLNELLYNYYIGRNDSIINTIKEKDLDMVHNLKMVSILYEMGMSYEADQLLENLEKYMRRSQNYVLEEYSLVDKAEKQEIEISARALYYYLLANWNREQYHGNER